MTNQTHATTIAVALAILATTACGNTMRGIKTDTEAIARDQAKGYIITNNLTVAAK